MNKRTMFLIIIGMGALISIGFDALGCSFSGPAGFSRHRISVIANRFEV